MAYIKSCSCSACRRGKHSAGSKAVTKKLVRSMRRKVKLACARVEDEKIPPFIAGGYTD